MKNAFEKIISHTGIFMKLVYKMHRYVYIIVLKYEVSKFIILAVVTLGYK